MMTNKKLYSFSNNTQRGFLLLTCLITMSMLSINATSLTFAAGEAVGTAKNAIGGFTCRSNRWD